MSKVVKLKLSDDLYKELEERAKSEGYALVTDYIRELLARELSRSPTNPREIEARLERLERGELPPRLYDAIWRVVEEVLSSKLSSLSEEGIEVSMNEEEIVNKVVKKVERKLQDMIIPWTQKIDTMAKKIA